MCIGALTQSPADKSGSHPANAGAKAGAIQVCRLGSKAPITSKEAVSECGLMPDGASDESRSVKTSCRHESLDRGSRPAHTPMQNGLHHNPVGRLIATTGKDNAGRRQAIGPGDAGAEPPGATSPRRSAGTGASRHPTPHRAHQRPIGNLAEGVWPCGRLMGMHRRQSPCGTKSSWMNTFCRSKSPT